MPQVQSRAQRRARDGLVSVEKRHAKELQRPPAALNRDQIQKQHEMERQAFQEEEARQKELLKNRYERQAPGQPNPWPTPAAGRSDDDDRRGGRDGR
jgi:hypothetical protein